MITFYALLDHNHRLLTKVGTTVLHCPEIKSFFFFQGIFIRDNLKLIVQCRSQIHEFESIKATLSKASFKTYYGMLSEIFNRGFLEGWDCEDQNKALSCFIASADVAIAKVCKKKREFFDLFCNQRQRWQSRRMCQDAYGAGVMTGLNHKRQFPLEEINV